MSIVIVMNSLRAIYENEIDQTVNHPSKNLQTTPLYIKVILLPESIDILCQNKRLITFAHSSPANAPDHLPLILTDCF